MISIACAVDTAYLLPLSVMLTSLKAHLGAPSDVVLYLIHSRLPDAAVTAIGRIVRTEPIVPPPDLLSSLPRDARFPPEASAALILADILPPALDRVLFLDADLLVLDDIGDLWRTDLTANTLAAVQDSAIPRCGAPRAVKNVWDFGIPSDAPYFNGGVLLVDLHRWREHHVRERARDYFRKTPAPDFLHQEALNAVLWNEWTPLASRWNLLATVAGRRASRASERVRPGIVHFAGRPKPWKVRTGGPFDAEYRRWLADVGERQHERVTVRDRLVGAYDRLLRDHVYWLERALWNRRIV